MSLVVLIVFLIVVGLLLWAVKQLPLDPQVMKIIYVVVIVACVLWLLEAVGLLPSTPIKLR